VIWLILNRKKSPHGHQSARCSAPAPPPEAVPDAPARAEAVPDAVADYDPVTLHRQRHDGWTAARQRTFLVALAETGCISEACRLAGISARSAYRLRAHALGARFAEVWDAALRYATARLMTLAYERAIRGTTRETWRDGKLIAESRAPSDRLLIFLLGNLAPWQTGQGSRWAKLHGMAGDAASALAPVLGALTDCDVACDALSEADFLAQPIANPDARVRPFDEDCAEE